MIHEHGLTEDKLSPNREGIKHPQIELTSAHGSGGGEGERGVV